MTKLYLFASFIGCAIGSLVDDSGTIRWGDLSQWFENNTRQFNSAYTVGGDLIRRHQDLLQQDKSMRNVFTEIAQKGEAALKKHGDSYRLVMYNTLRLLEKYAQAHKVHAGIEAEYNRLKWHRPFDILSKGLGWHRDTNAKILELKWLYALYRNTVLLTYRVSTVARDPSEVKDIANLFVTVKRDTEFAVTVKQILVDEAMVRVTERTDQRDLFFAMSIVTEAIAGFDWDYDLPLAQQLFLIRARDLFSQWDRNARETVIGGVTASRVRALLRLIHAPESATSV